MEYLLDEKDYRFYNTDRYAPKKYFIVTNEGVHEKEPSNKETITHLRTINTKKNLYKLKIVDYENLQTLIIDFSEIDKVNLENLPYIKTLIIKNTEFLDVYEIKSFMFNNLPVTLEKIIFANVENMYEGYKNYELSRNYFLLQILKKKLTLCKLPFGCKIYYIDCNNKIHAIID